MPTFSAIPLFIVILVEICYNGSALTMCTMGECNMALLESITIGTYVFGIDNSNAPVTVISVKWHGTNALTVTYRSANGTVGEQILYREDEPNL